MSTREYLESEITRLRIKLVHEKSNVMTLTNEITILNHKIKKMRQTINDKDEDINKIYGEFKKLENAIY